MRSSNHWAYSQIAVCLALLLAMPATGAGTAIAQQATPTQPPQSASIPQAAEDKQVTKTAAYASASENTLPENPAPASPQAADQSGPGNASQTGSGQQQNSAQKPVGTAAAPYERTMGVAASRPAGAAIAPAKQRRVRTILISVGVIVGAGIAVGSVAALSHGSPSRP